MIKFNHKGDFLTFCNLAMAVCPELVECSDQLKLLGCYRDDDSVIRYQTIGDDPVDWTRSSISPDALMTGLFERAVNGPKDVLPDWFWHCLKRGGFMKGWGPREYLWMGVPMVTALCLRFNLPLVPQPLGWAEKAKGYRAELAAMYVLLDIVHRGKITDRHEEFICNLYGANRHGPMSPSPLIRTMFRKIMPLDNIVFDISDEDRTDWGSCPGPVYRELLKFIREL